MASDDPDDPSPARLKDLEQAALNLENQLLKNKLANTEASSPRLVASGQNRANSNTNHGTAKVGCGAPFSAIGPSLFSDIEPQRKRFKPNHSAAEPSKPEKERRVPCSKCFVHGWECDKFEPCENCMLRNKHTKCRRVKCKFFATGTCPEKDNCKYAHEDGGYQHLAPHRKIRRVGLGEPEPAVELKELREWGSDDDEFDDLDLKLEIKEEEGNADEYGDMFNGL